ncbi:PP2C family protein-serine/threonine phosphatase [Rudaeicoccus suwonensis]|uniref:Serine/threonine protein phosphatase PrpC n=1 Tax=Rudaeicoccus suwonensis TaxID=657409 RepID=A0A561E334_9MICO|nr:PP2C family serine/threonine-protein phosphatase [Rudaeicoccus suwonensis]TWE10016.1 serine/threonine protein phosphatase PrpC [Rudaeicoccus suwonensis]
MATAPDPAPHVALDASGWVGTVSDIGRRHHRNEDAVAIYAEPVPGSFAAMVVCDGVSTSTDSHLASQAAVGAAIQVLAAAFTDDNIEDGTDDDGTDAWLGVAERALAQSVLAADEAASEVADPDDPTPPSCTFAGALICDGFVIGGNVGDSRVYWLPDSDPAGAAQLGADDSMATELALRGVPIAQAEASPNAHAITRWLGRESPDMLTPRAAHLAASEPGWVVVCSDGLWNYCSAAADQWDLLQRTRAMAGESPVAIAEGLVAFANSQGGADNISVALARVIPAD